MPIRVVKVQETDIPSAETDVGQQKLIQLLVEMPNGRSTLEDGLTVLTELSISLCNPVIVLLCLCPIDLKS